MALLKSGTRIYGNATIDTNLVIDGNASSTSNSTGALTVAGGVGIAGNIFSTGNLVAANANLGNAATANYFIGDGSLLTNISASNISGLYSDSNVANYLPTYTGNLSANDVQISGNLSVNGTLEYTNVNNLYIKDPIIEQGGDANGSPLVSDDNKDRGSLLHYYDGSAVDAFIGWKNANSEFVVASNASASNNTVTINELGNLRANVFIGNLSGAANTVSSSSQPNITSVGTLGNLTVSNNIFAPSLVSNAVNDTRIELGTDTGIITVTSSGNSTQFLPSGQINLGGSSIIAGGTFAGSLLELATSQTNLKQTRGGDVTIQVGSGGTTTNTWTFAQDGSLTAPGNISTTGKFTVGNLEVSNGISANGSYGNLFDVLTSDGNGNVDWKARYYYSTVMYDFTAYGMGYQTIAPNQDPDTLGFLSNVTIPHGSVWMLVTNDGIDDPAPITIYSPNSKATPMMWVTIDGSGPYDPDNNPAGGDYWFNITPPA